MLTLFQLTIAFQDTDCIRCDLTLQPGEICAIIGPSGVGKSTLLLALAGFHPLSSGDMRWHGTSFANDAVWERPLSLLFQSDNLFGHISAEKNIKLAAPKTANKQEIRTKIDDITKKLGVFDILSQSAATLSGGQQQRVALARALISDKPILLLDEPFSALDKDNRQKALQLVKQITSDHQLTTLIVTHDEDDISWLGARSILLKREAL